MRIQGDTELLMKKNFWILLIMILSGLVLGGFIGKYVPWEWLNYGGVFGLTSPIQLDLCIITITFGLSINITIASIIGIAVAIIIYRFL